MVQRPWIQSGSNYYVYGALCKRTWRHCQPHATIHFVLGLHLKGHSLIYFSATKIITMQVIIIKSVAMGIQKASPWTISLAAGSERSTATLPSSLAWNIMHRTLVLLYPARALTTSASVAEPRPSLRIEPSLESMFLRQVSFNVQSMVPVGSSQKNSACRPSA